MKGSPCVTFQFKLKKSVCPFCLKTLFTLKISQRMRIYAEQIEAKLSHQQQKIE